MSDDQQRRAWADVNLDALTANIRRIRQLNRQATINPVIKANAYGHGVEAVARVLSAEELDIRRLAVATIDEVISLNLLGTGKPILLLQGCSDETQLDYLVEAGVELVIHADYQLQLLKRALKKKRPPAPLTVWLKVDTGMHRLGMTTAEAREAWRSLKKLPQVGQIILMSHLAWADEEADARAITITNKQLAAFTGLWNELSEESEKPPERSLAASAGILAWPTTHFEHLRPGIMLYGGSPFASKSGSELGLRPVMTLKARLIAVKQVKAGESIGYGATYTCDRDTRIGVVSVGYGDGYPRSAPTGTPVLVATPDGYRRSCLLGRVSMDMITLDLSGFGETEVGDEVVLWGEGLDADEVARFAGTLSYELFCRVTARVPRLYRETPGK